MADTANEKKLIFILFVCDAEQKHKIKQKPFVEMSSWAREQFSSWMMTTNVECKFQKWQIQWKSAYEDGNENAKAMKNWHEQSENHIFVRSFVGLSQCHP